MQDTVTGSALFDRTIAFDYGDVETSALVQKVWSATPWMTNCKTDGPDADISREIMDWCRAKWGEEAWPIHGRLGKWQRGSATIFGWTWFGFATEEMLKEFQAKWDCRDAV